MKKCIKTLPKNNDGKNNQPGILCCIFSPQGNIIATGDQHGIVRLYDVRTGNQIGDALEAHSEYITSLDFADDGTLLLTASVDGLVRIYSVEERTLTTTIGEKTIPISMARFSPNGKYILVGSMNSKLKLWEFEKTKCCKTYTGHKNTRHCMYAEFNTISEPLLIISGSECGYIYAWDLQKKDTKFTIQAHKTPIISVGIHPKDDIFASSGLYPDSTVKIWKRRIKKRKRGDK